MLAAEGLVGILLLVGAEAGSSLTGGLAAAGMGVKAGGAAEEQPVAVHVGTVVVAFDGSLAVVAFASDGSGGVGKGHGQAIVEDE